MNMNNVHSILVSVRRRKRDIEAPAKLLDDLFRKTKTIPCLYWLPLTAEQVRTRISYSRLLFKQGWEISRCLIPGPYFSLFYKFVRLFV